MARVDIVIPEPTLGGKEVTPDTDVLFTFEFGTTPDKPSEASILPAVRTLLANPLVLAPI